MYFPFLPNIKLITMHEFDPAVVAAANVSTITTEERGVTVDTGTREKIPEVVMGKADTEGA